MTGADPYPGKSSLAVRLAVAAVASLIAIAALAACGSSTTGGATGASAPARFRQQFLAFAACMRSRGLPSYPDPKFSISSDGVQVRISPGTLDPNSPEFGTAERACHHLTPDGGNPGAGAGTRELAQDVAFATCMRSHGVSNFPDPDRHGDFSLPSAIDEHSPLFQAAMRACTSAKPSSLVLNQSPGGT